jgi:hypothetical protein
MPRHFLFLCLALLLMVATVTPSAATGAQGIAPLAPNPLYLPLVAKNAGGPALGGCAMFPPDNPWNTDISNYPVHPNSAAFIADINSASNKFLHADFGSDPTYGIPYVVVPGSQISVTISYYPPPVGFGDESDPGPYPIPPDAPVEAGSDAHVLVLNSGTCRLYELYNANKDPGGSGWHASSGAVFDLNSNALRPEGWTSADAAGLPILPGLARHDEVASGVIKHALRFTVWRTQRGYIHPATHFAGATPSAPPMGLRLRLKASFDLTPYQSYPQTLTILTALKKYGMIVADNGSSWFISGAPYTGPGPGWDDNDLNQLKSVPGTAFEAVYTGDIIIPP